MAYIHKDDDFTLNCRPTGTMGCEEQVADVKCTSSMNMINDKIFAARFARPIQRNYSIYFLETPLRQYF